MRLREKFKKPHKNTLGKIITVVDQEKFLTVEKHQKFLLPNLT